MLIHLKNPGSDKYMKPILESESFEELSEYAKEFYDKLHHTDAKDKENKRFKEIALRVGGRVKLT